MNVEYVSHTQLVATKNEYGSSDMVMDPSHDVMRSEANHIGMCLQERSSTKATSLLILSHPFI